MNELNAPMSYQYGTPNYDPNDVDQERVLLSTIAVDNSPSIDKFVNDLNTKFKEYLLRAQTAHTAEEMMLQVITFSSDVKIEHGFRPIIGVDANDVNFTPRSGMTAGYDALRVALETSLDYGRQLEAVGTEVVYNIAIITDGQFNDGNDIDGSSVRAILDQIRQDERLYGKFTVTLSGINKDYKSYFKEAQQNIGLKDDAVNLHGDSGSEIHDMMMGISKSQSSSSSGTQNVTF